jgi:hypothetical protein
MCGRDVDESDDERLRGLRLGALSRRSREREDRGEREREREMEPL